MWGSNHKYKQIIQTSKRQKSLKIRKVNPTLQMKDVCIKQLGIFKNTESYKKVLSSHFFKSL